MSLASDRSQRQDRRCTARATRPEETRRDEQSSERAALTATGQVQRIAAQSHCRANAGRVLGLAPLHSGRRPYSTCLSITSCGTARALPGCRSRHAARQLWFFSSSSALVLVVVVVVVVVVVAAAAFFIPSLPAGRHESHTSAFPAACCGPPQEFVLFHRFPAWRQQQLADSRRLRQRKGTRHHSKSLACPGCRRPPRPRTQQGQPQAEDGTQDGRRAPTPDTGRRGEVVEHNGIKNASANLAQQLKALRSDFDSLRSHLTCKICDRLLYQPYTIACGHTYCYSVSATALRLLYWMLTLPSAFARGS